ncbi:MAG: hypothetical protein ABWX84_11220 [Nocardioides sp.]
MSHFERPHDTSGDPVPPELLYADSDRSRPESTLPLWVRLTALILVVSVIAFFGLSTFL